MQVVNNIKDYLLNIKSWLNQIFVFYSSTTCNSISEIKNL